MKTSAINNTHMSEVEVSPDGPPEGARRATVGGPSGGRLPKFQPPDPEVPEKKRRRKFTAKYKLKILEEADQCREPGDIGALLRREGLYSSHLTNWRRQRQQGILNGLTPSKRGRKKSLSNPLASEVALLQSENRQLKQKLKQAEIIIEAQKKISQIMDSVQMISQFSASNS